MPRQPDGDRAMTSAERQRLYRARLRQARGPRISLREHVEDLRMANAALRKQIDVLGQAARQEIEKLRQRIRELEGKRR